MALRVTDEHPAIAIKETVLCRSGIYEYSYQEMLDRGLRPKVVKPVYKEYRPVDVVRAAADKFAFVASTVEHTKDETTPDNFREQAIGVIGDRIWEKELPNGEVALMGNLAFLTKDGWDYYKQGNSETSADYRSRCEPAPAGAPYDYILTSIESVNGVVLTARGRGGHEVRVMDSAIDLFTRTGTSMAGKSGVLGFLGIGRSKDSEFKLSNVVFNGLKTLHTLDEAGKEKLVGDIMSHITPLTDSSDKEFLIGAVKDSFANPADVIKQEEKVSSAIDTLYARCTDAEAKAAEEVLKSVKDAFPDKDKDDDKDDKKKTEDTKDCDDPEMTKKTKDSKSMEELFDTFEKRINDSIEKLIDKKVQESLGLKPADPKATAPRTEDSLPEDFRSEASFLLDGIFKN